MDKHDELLAPLREAAAAYARAVQDAVVDEADRAYVLRSHFTNQNAAEQSVKASAGDAFYQYRLPAL